MMIVQFEPEHAAMIEVVPGQEGWAFARDPVYGEALKAAGPAHSGLVDGKVIVCAGMIVKWPGYAEVWAMFSPAAGKHMLRITRAVKRGITELYPMRRLEAAVRADYELGHVWARLLGFNPEGPLEAYTPDGADAVRYVRIDRQWKP